MTRKIIFDTDPGQDDAVAILVALASPEELDVLGLVTVAGNVGVALTSRNARQIVELAGRSDVPVFAGCDRPTRRASITGSHVHGEGGLNGPDLPPPTTPLRPEHGVDFIIETLAAHEPGTVTLCTLGPLTNVATALERAPDVVRRAEAIVMMGGGYFEVGNITPVAEFNIYFDPEAADALFRSGIPIVMHPLDVTHGVLNTPARLDRFAGLGNRTGKAVAEMLRFSETFDLAKYGWHGAPLHDPCVTAWLLRPDLFQTRAVNVTIETTSELTMGMTVVDYWQVTDRPHNATFVRSVDATGFYDLLAERLARLP
ncbi:nucleoside hydrolase [Bauldia sp.]|uniref:nucleoside hydrolase n=1 Tax=Bauldia sp. TaxID=2575872 RepID=UPI003BABF562